MLIGAQITFQPREKLFLLLSESVSGVLSSRRQPTRSHEGDTEGITMGMTVAKDMDHFTPRLRNHC